MKTRIVALWDSFRSSYWFVPAVMTAAAIAGGGGILESAAVGEQHLRCLRKVAAVETDRKLYEADEVRS